MKYVIRNTLVSDIMFTTANNRDIYVPANSNFALFYGDTYKCLLTYKGPTENFLNFIKDDVYFSNNKIGDLDLLKIIQSNDSEIDMCNRERIDYYFGSYLLVDQVIVFKYNQDTVYIFITNAQVE